MIKKTKSLGRPFGISFVLAVFFMTAVLAGAVNGKDKSDEAMFLDLVRHMDQNAREIEQKAENLDEYIRTPVVNSWEAHSAEWALVVSKLEEMAELVSDLRAIEGMNDWQKQLAKRINSRVAAMADQADDAVNILEKEREKIKLQHRDYTVRVAALHVYADTIDRLADYGKTRCELERLEK